MKTRFLLLLSLLSLALGVRAAMPLRSIPASDPRIVYVGRTEVADQQVSFDWTGTYVRIRFVGKELKLRVRDNIAHNYFNLTLDRPFSAYPDTILPTAADTLWTLASFKKKGEHTILLQKRTEGEQGTVTFVEFLTDGELLQAEPLHERMIEFIGDSYTCGYGAELTCTKADPFTPETESQSLTYAAIIARYFDADYVAVAHSGMGIARNYNSKFANWYMPHRYLQTFDTDSTAAHRWDYRRSPFRPAVSVIYLGTNDFSTGLQPHYELFKNYYLQLIRSIQANWGPSHPILCVASPADEYLGIYVQRLVKESGISSLHYVVYEPSLYNQDSDLGASWHPNYRGHQKIAHELIPHIATVTSWPLPESDK